MLPSDILVRLGGSPWKRYGVPTIRRTLASKGGEQATPTTARADVSTCASFFNRDGTLGLASANLPRIHWVDTDGDGILDTPTFLSEGSRTNVALWNRDLTNAAWTKTSCTPLKNQTGVDGVASSASLLTATGANATCLQAITLASSVRFQSCYIKRVTGSGTIQMTTDGGSTYTTVTVTTAWTRVSIPAQTLANPSVGFKIVTSGDAVAIDFVQNENGAFASAPIATTTAAVTRATDSFTLPIAFGPQDLSIYMRLARTPQADAVGSIADIAGIYDLGDASNNHAWSYLDSTSRVVYGAIRGATTDQSATPPNIPAGTPLRFLQQVKNLTTTGGQSAIDVGTGLSAFSAATEAFTAWANQRIRVGGIVNANGRYWGGVIELIVVRGLVTMAQVEAIL